MKSKKKKARLDKQSSASIVLAFTMMFFLITMFMASKAIETSYSLVTTGGSTVPDTLTFNGTIFDQPVDKWHFASSDLVVGFDFKATDGTNTYDMYCIEGQTGVNGSDTYNNPSEMSSTYSTGMSWLLKNSYPKVKNNEYMNVCGNDDNCKKYITQYAIWLYLNDYTTPKQLDDTQLAALNEDNAYTKAIKKLAADAKTHNIAETAAISIDTSKIQFTVDGDYMISNEISVTTNKEEFLESYSVSSGFGGSGQGGPITVDAIIVDRNGNESSYANFAKGDTFRLKVAIDSFKEYIGTDSEVIINAAVSGVFSDGVFEYQSTTGSQRPIISTVSNINRTIPLSLPITQITKSDITNGKPVEGATLVVKDSNDNEVASWVTDANPHYISLKQGDYTLCETTAPDGYELNTECVPFTVKSDRTITKVEMKNTPTTPAPDTASNIPIYLYVIGTMILVIGSVVIYYTVKPKNKK